MRPVIGYNYGAGEHKRVKKIYFVTLCMSGVIMLIGTIICLTVPGQLIGMFTTNPETIAAGKTALRIICAGFLVSSVSVTSCGALEGLGRGSASLVVSLCRYLIIILPAAFILSHFFGAVGVDILCHLIVWFFQPCTLINVSFQMISKRDQFHFFI